MVSDQERADNEMLFVRQSIAERGISKARAALDEAKRRHCPHGVRWRNCRQHDGHVVAGEVVTDEETE